MMTPCFAIDILELCWLSGTPEETDLCAHGVVRIRLGGHVLEDEVSMSASALHLLRSVTDDHEPDELAKLFPIGGYSWTPAGDAFPYPIYLGGCPNGGFDGTVIHEGDIVRVALEGLPEVRVPIADYRAEVFRFADAVEGLFAAGKTKIVREGSLDELWYPLFWEEWHKLRGGSAFALDILEKYWLDGMPEEEDLCLHGEVRVRIGDDVRQEHVCLSASAINLLRTLTEDRGLNPNAQALAGTGHAMFTWYREPDLPRVLIEGAPCGIDWFVNHDGEDVILQLPGGPEVTVPLPEYCAQVLAFADEAEAFYRTSKPKELSPDNIHVDGYLTMWQEWHWRRNQFE